MKNLFSTPFNGLSTTRRPSSERLLRKRLRSFRMTMMTNPRRRLPPSVNNVPPSVRSPLPLRQSTNSMSPIESHSLPPHQAFNNQREEGHAQSSTCNAHRFREVRWLIVNRDLAGSRP